MLGEVHWYERCLRVRSGHEQTMCIASLTSFLRLPVLSRAVTSGNFRSDGTLIIETFESHGEYTNDEVPFPRSRLTVVYDGRPSGSRATVLDVQLKSYIIGTIYQNDEDNVEEWMMYIEKDLGRVSSQEAMNHAMIDRLHAVRETSA